MAEIIFRRPQRLRVNDRDFPEGDELYLREWNPLRRKAAPMGLTQLASERVVRRYRCGLAADPSKQGAKGRIKLAENSTPSEPAWG